MFCRRSRDCSEVMVDCTPCLRLVKVTVREPELAHLFGVKWCSDSGSLKALDLGSRFARDVPIECGFTGAG